MAAFVKALAARYVPGKRLVAGGPACGAGSTQHWTARLITARNMDVINANTHGGCTASRRTLCQQLLEDMTTIGKLAAAPYQDADDGEANY